MFRAFSRPSSWAQWLQWQPLVLPSFRGDSRAVFHTYPPMKMEQSVPKRRHIKFERRGITQKKAYGIQNMAKVWNQE
jgi:hypothetical protein